VLGKPSRAEPAGAGRIAAPGLGFSDAQFHVADDGRQYDYSMWRSAKSHLKGKFMRQKSRKRMTVESLERRELLSTLVAETEPNDRKSAADEITFDVVDGAADLTGSIAMRRDRDFFAFTAAADGPVGLNLTPSNGFVGKVNVESAAGVELFETEPNDGVNSGFFNVVAGQRIFIRVRGQSGSTGDYNVHLSLTGDAGGGSGGGGEPGNALAESEPNNTKGAADRFDLGSDGTIELEGTSDSSRDKDFFVFTPATTGTLNVAVQSPNGNFAQLEVETNQGVSVFETEPNDGVNSGSFQVVAGTTYFLRLRARGIGPAAYLVDLALA
jgi:hypothetical protein